MVPPVIDVFPPTPWITNVDDGSRYGSRMGWIVGGLVLPCCMLAVLWLAQGGNPWLGACVFVGVLLAACGGIPIYVERGIRAERRSFEIVRDNTAEAAITRFCALVRPMLAFRSIPQLARRLLAIGAQGKVYRLLHEPSPLELGPLNIPFEPVALTATDPRFVALERSDDSAWNERESRVSDQVRRIANQNRCRIAAMHTACLLGALLHGLTTGNWGDALIFAVGIAGAGTAVQVLTSRLRILRHFITAGAIIHIRPSLICGRPTLKVFHRTDSTMVILPHKSGLAFIGLADENRTHVLGCLPREADLLLRAWLSSAGAPTRAQIASMFDPG